MSAKSATLAKSLHTVSVLVAVARHYQDLARYDGQDLDARDAVLSAQALLGYQGASDPHNITARAVAQLVKGAQL